MRSIKTKILAPVYTMAGLFILFMALQLISIQYNAHLIHEMEQTYFTTVRKADELKLGVVQVQQWLTDISATRAAEGFDDGLDEAAVYAARVRELIGELKALAPDEADTLEEIAASFEPYYATGQEMANAYITKGPEGGNLMMEKFDGVASDINDRVDGFITLASANIDGAVARVERSINISTVLAVIAALAAAFLSVFCRTVIVKKLIRPVTEIRSAANELSQGNLGVTVSYRSNDEIGRLAQDMQLTIQTLGVYISDISHCMQQMQNGDLTVLPQADFKGDFIALRDSIVHFNASINQILSMINQSAHQVAAGSAQVSGGAQQLAQGASEQADSIETLSSAIETVSDQIRENAQTAEKANSRAREVGGETQESARQMQRMLTAMQEISDSSNQIGKIIKTIEDIAFQTNILALNASVEAARAGAAGKGFAVVADEVRNLAGKSAEAASNSTALIEGSLRAVENGSAIAGDTARSLDTVVQGIQQVAATIETISDASSQQAQAVRGITGNVEQISGVVQTISSTAQQSGAASEELAGQSQTLKDLIATFKIREEGDLPMVL